MSEGLDEFEALAAGKMEDAEPDDAGPDHAERKIFVMPDPAMEECPVTPLGFYDDKLVFAMPEGEIRTAVASKVGAMLKVDIFACAAGQSFLSHYFRDEAEQKFLRDLAAIWFVRKCRQAGKFDRSRTERGLGIWPGEAGTVVLHRGDELIEVDFVGKARRVTIAEAMRRTSGPLYSLRPRAPEPKGKFALADAVWAREALDMWRFEPIGDEGLTGADVVLGWVGGAMLGAAAPFRGHLLIHALAGSGKTTLMHFLQGLMSGLAGEVISKFTEAGLRSDLAGNARPVLLDEAEARADSQGGGDVEKVMELIRDMATGSGSNRKQGSMDGTGMARTQTAVGAVLMAAINPPRLTPQDVSRVVEVRMLPLGGVGGVTDDDLLEALEKAIRLAPALLGRVLKSAGRYRGDVAMLKAALARRGQAPRAADLIAMLAAGRRLLMFDAPLTLDEAEMEVAFWAPLLVERETQGRTNNPGADAMAHLLAWDSGQHSKDRRATLGELIERNAITEKGLYEDVLKAHGLLTGLSDGYSGAPVLIVSNNHPALERIYRGTVWTDWPRALRNLDVLGEAYQTRPTKNSVRFGAGEKQRGTIIPLTPWFDRLSSDGGGTVGGTVGVPEEPYDFQ